MKKLIALFAILAAVAADAQVTVVNAPPASSLFSTPPPTPPASLAPTNPPSVGDGFKLIADSLQSPPYYVAIYGLYAPGLQNKYGGGIGFFKPAVTNSLLRVVGGVRVDYVDGGFWMPSGNATLEIPLHPLKNFNFLPSWAIRLTVTPFAYAGIGIPLSGATIYGTVVPGVIRNNNGQATAILGQGLAMGLYSPTNANWGLMLVADRETWSGFAGTQYRGGILYNRKF